MMSEFFIFLTGELTEEATTFLALGSLKLFNCPKVSAFHILPDPAGQITL